MSLMPPIRIYFHGFDEELEMKHFYWGTLAVAMMVASPAWALDKVNSHKVAKTTAATAAPMGQVWDWSKIDTNKDNLIEPAEMEAWLRANPGVQKGG
jgi:hypothetical protein